MHDDNMHDSMAHTCSQISLVIVTQKTQEDGYQGQSSISRLWSSVNKLWQIYNLELAWKQDRC